MSKQPSTPIESLASKLRKRFPTASVALDPPAQATSGVWYLDVTHEGHHVVVQWREGAALGVSSSPTHAYGEGPDEVYPDVESTFGRLVSLLLSRSATSPPPTVKLRQLRKERGMSQAQLAAVLQKQQGEVSKIERRSDVLVSTLRDVVESMGGTLQITAHFPDGQERILELGNSDTAL